MRKSKINYIYDLVYYAFFAIIPIIAYLISCNHHDNLTLVAFFTEFGIDSTNIVFQSFVDMFGTNGFLPLLSDTSTLFYLFTYMSIIVFMHLVFDLLVFLPKLAHCYLDKYVKGVSNE